MIILNKKIIFFSFLVILMYSHLSYIADLLTLDKKDKYVMRMP